jgi:putative thiamine transport system ATP-binding protein
MHPHCLSAPQYTPMPLQVHIRSLRSPQRTLIENLHLQIADGSVHTLMGASGCGKSSLLAALCGTLPEPLKFDGEITLHAQRIEALPTQLRRIGILFQEDLLFAHMTVRENLLFALPRGPQAQREASVAQMLTDVEMEPFLHADPATLSGGQRARVSLARALLARPKALLLDEPFSKLDAQLRGRMRTLVFDMVRQREIPALLVTHDAADVADAALLTQI